MKSTAKQFLPNFFPPKNQINWPHKGFLERNNSVSTYHLFSTKVAVDKLLITEADWHNVRIRYKAWNQMQDI